MNTQAEKFLRTYIKTRFKDTMTLQIDLGHERNKQYCKLYDDILMQLRKEAYDFPASIRTEIYTIVNHPPLLKRMFAEYFTMLDDYIGCKPTGEPATALAAAMTRQLMIDNVLEDLK